MEKIMSKTTMEARELTTDELTADALEHITGGAADGTKGAVVQAGWNLCQNKKAA
jgi:hypothetical protein